MKMEVSEKLCELVSAVSIIGLLTETIFRIGEKLSASELTWPTVFRPVMLFVFAILMSALLHFVFTGKWPWEE